VISSAAPARPAGPSRSPQHQRGQRGADQRFEQGHQGGSAGRGGAQAAEVRRVRDRGRPEGQREHQADAGRAGGEAQAAVCRGDRSEQRGAEGERPTGRGEGRPSRPPAGPAAESWWRSHRPRAGRSLPPASRAARCRLPSGTPTSSTAPRRRGWAAPSAPGPTRRRRRAASAISTSTGETPMVSSVARLTPNGRDRREGSWPGRPRRGRRARRSAGGRRAPRGSWPPGQHEKGDEEEATAAEAIGGDGQWVEAGVAGEQGSR